MSDKSQIPILQAIVLCDCVYADAATGKKVIAGTFNTLWAAEFPTQFARSTFVYLSLTDVHDHAVLQLHYVDLKTNDILLGLDKLHIAAASPLECVEVALEIPPLPMPHPGVYAFEVHCEGTIVGTIRIHVQQMVDIPRTNGSG